MKQLLLFTVSLLFCNIIFAQKITISGRILDAVTGDVLPYATVQSSANSQGTITNMEGDYSLMTDSNDTICIRFVGYETQYIKACDMPRTVKLTPWNRLLDEVTIMAGNNLLMKINKLLIKEYNKYKTKNSQYFFRLSTTTNQTMDVAEGFITAQSMGNLRDLKMVTGYHGSKNREGREQFRIEDMNFQHMLELGPWMNLAGFWSRTASPLNPYVTSYYLQQHFDITAYKLKDSQGAYYYLIDLKKSKNWNYPNGIITGKLYVDANTMQLLRFDGRVEGITLITGGLFNRAKTPLDIRVAINFNHSHKYSEVLSMACTMTDDSLGIKSKGILFNVDDVNLNNARIKQKKQKNQEAKKLSHGDNLLNIINDVGYNHQVWESSNIIKRTSEEERILRYDKNEEEALDIADDSSISDSDTINALVGTKSFLYRISGNGLVNDSYIFGSFHYAGTNTLNKIYGLREALDIVEQVCAEKANVINDSIPDDEDVSDKDNNVLFSESSASNQGFMQGGFEYLPDKMTTKNIFTKEQFQRVSAVTRRFFGSGFESPFIYDSMKKFTPGMFVRLFTYMTIAEKMERVGRSRNQYTSFDNYIKTIASFNGKKILGLDRPEDEPEYKGEDMSIEMEVASLMTFIDNMKSNEEELDLMIKYYFEEPDFQKFCAIGEKGPDYSKVDERLLYQRNANWLKRMPEMMRRGSTLFVVGAGHLPGERGVLKGLQDAGYIITEVKAPEE